MFKVGDLVTGIDGVHYGITTKRSLCIVNEIYGERYMNVSVLVHADGEGHSCDDTEVERRYFVPCTYEEFMEKYPEAVIVRGHSFEEIPNGKEIKKMETIMNKEKIGSYELTTEERDILRKEIFKLLRQYDYNPTEIGVNNILDEWIKNKGWMINVFKKHPNYNGKFQIAFDSDYQRVCDSSIISDFVYYARTNAKHYCCEEKQFGVFSYIECKRNYIKLKNIVECVDEIVSSGHSVMIDKMSYEELVAEKNKWARLYESYRYSDEIKIEDGVAYDKKKYNLYDNFYYICDKIYNFREPIADDEFAASINHYIPEIKAVAGQKVSRIVNKVCKFIGIDKHENFNREFARYSDAINPLTIKRHTVLSCHPVDYLTMSFGNSWASCHTIDKNNKRDMPDNYEGCYSSGTLSYMLDGSSFVYYTVDKDYNGNELELQDKINRNMFHMGEDKLIQARVYPQSTDGEGGIYKQIREIAQKVIADCLEVPNMWINSKGTSACSAVTYSYGTHYKDYTHYSDCNVSYLKYEEDNVYKNTSRIYIGHNPICPNCGRSHDYEKAIECERCYDEEKCCSECGSYGYADNMHYIDGDWYCEDCCFYCEYHEEWETGDYTYVESYGRVCDDALESGDFYQCEECGNYYYENYRESIIAEDDTHFCSSRCVERSDYGYTHNGSLYPEEEVHFCEHCERDVHSDDWNDELRCCVDCEEEVRGNENNEEIELVEAV